MLNLFQHLTYKVYNMLATCPVRSRNKFGMTNILDFYNSSGLILSLNSLANLFSFGWITNAQYDLLGLSLK
ncbi:hypothetical protein SAMN05428975_0017 [Mucilaginibacter sp. OK268]|nr:hypothetical protein SAMN05428975_0017 [Mucilaginibacter sp. OK268]